MSEAVILLVGSSDYTILFFLSFEVCAFNISPPTYLENNHVHTLAAGISSKLLQFGLCLAFSFLFSSLSI